MRHYRKRRRSSIGHEFAEFAPAIFVLLIVILFPMLDLIYLGIGYACGWYLNHLQVREVACVAPGSGPAAAGSALAAWQASGLCRFTNGSQTAAPNITYLYLDTTDPTFPSHCRVTTSVRIQPWLQVPFMGGIPGIGAPVDFTYTAERTQEEKGKN